VTQVHRLGLGCHRSNRRDWCELTGAYLHAVGSTHRMALDLAGQPVLNVTAAACAALSARLLRSLAATTTTAGKTALDLSVSISLSLSLASSDARSSVSANADAVFPSR